MRSWMFVILKSALSLPFSLNEQWSVKNFGIDFDHFLFILPFSFSLLSFELFYPFLYHSPWMRNITLPTIFQYRPDIRCELLLSHFSHCWCSFLLIELLLLLLLLMLSQVHQGLVFHCYRNVHLFFFLVLRLLWTFKPVDLPVDLLDGRFWTGWPVLEREWNHFGRLLLLLLVFEINSQVFMYHLKVWYTLSNFRIECAFDVVGSGFAQSSLSLLFLLRLVRSFDHLFHSFRQVIFAVLIDYFLKYSLPSLIFLLLNPFK